MGFNRIHFLFKRIKIIYLIYRSFKKFFFYAWSIAPLDIRYEKKYKILRICDIEGTMLSKILHLFELFNIPGRRNLNKICSIGNCDYNHNSQSHPQNMTFFTNAILCVINEINYMENPALKAVQLKNEVLA